MVRLQLKADIDIDAITGIVSIPLWFDYNYIDFMNSIQLRLKSQFHYGSITTIKLRITDLYVSIVSIPLWFDYNYNITVLNVIENSKSQFHYGSITTDKVSKLILSRSYSLNSTMVRLQL